MLRVTTIYASSAGSAAAYYTKYLADSPGEVPGVWTGAQAAALGLAGDVDALVATLSTGGSTWNRADVLSALCDIATVNPDVDGPRWVAIVERVADQVLERCVELDPAETSAPRRHSDGRSLWIEPTAPHFTTDAILREEELVLSWALDAQTAPPTPSRSVETTALDLLQADAAAAVAGHDRLVLIVGPAGTGKTTTLRAAADDLHHHQREVFGVAPSAKAARVLERETGVPSDTVAKLLHEWQRTDRPPTERYRLPAGATVLVDEAGMVGTHALARLATLATEHHWRIALIGDPHQLQAVGRGGLFNEMCATGRALELQRIHRFTAEWEAAASLQLRHGDPRGWNAYLEHGRVVPGTFDEHLVTAAHRWITTTANGGTIAVIASTNEHVDALNAAIQQLRTELGQLDPTHTTPIAGGERAMIGDHVVTRRNDRRITTDQGEPIRNRELWTVTGIADDGSLTVTANRGHGTAVLPAEYVHDHVRLGYAATEHGVQSDTTTIGVELVSPATTRRGAYVGLTRGREDNTVLVVTDSHDLDEARDILDRIITVDRADVPATTQRRELAAADRSPRRPEPRCEVPGWLPALRADLAQQLADISHRLDANETELRSVHSQLAAAEHEQARAQRHLDPHQPGLDAAQRATRAAQEQVWGTHSRAIRLNGRHRRAAVREHRNAQQALAAAKQHEADLQEAAAPAGAAVQAAATRTGELRQKIRSIEVFQRGEGASEHVAELRAALRAVDDWERWATGKPMTPARLVGVIESLRSEAVSNDPDCAALATAAEHWARPRGILPPAPALPALQPPTPSFGIEL